MSVTFLPEGQFTRTNRRYVVGGRNGWNQIDEYTERGMMRNVDGFKTRKQAEMTAGHLNQAYHDGYRDALIGLVLPLQRECEHRTYRPTESRTPIPAGTLVAVVKKDSAAFFTCKVVQEGLPCTGLEFDAQLNDLRPEPPVSE